MPTTSKSIFDFYDFEKVTYRSWGSIKSVPFFISFPEVVAGWLRIELSYNGKQIQYSASNCLGNDGLPTLLEAVVDLLNTVGDYDKYFKHLRSHTRFIHDLEPHEYVWDLSNSGPGLRILIRDSPYLEYEDDRFYHGYDEEELEFEYESVNADKLPGQVILAMEIDTTVFVAKLYVAVCKLLKDFGANTYKEEWGGAFPFDLMHRMEQYIMHSFPHNLGFWDYETNDFTLRFKGQLNSPTFEVIGKRMAPLDKLLKLA